MGSLPSDQSIEQTINREQKCHGGIKGYSTSAGTIQRWVLTSHTASKCIAVCTEMKNDFGNISSSRLPKDLGRSRISFNNKLVQRAYEVISNWRSPFQKRDTLVNVCSSVEASDEVQHGLLRAKQLGDTAMQKFIEDRIRSSKISF